VLCIKCVYLNVYIYCYRLCFQRLSRSFLLLIHYSSWVDHYEINKRMKKLVTVSALLPQSAYSRLCLAQPNFAPIPALQQYTCIWITSFVPRHFKYKAHSDNFRITFRTICRFVSARHLCQYLVFALCTAIFHPSNWTCRLWHIYYLPSLQP
jgi:hypothetical protein